MTSVHAFFGLTAVALLFVLVLRGGEKSKTITLEELVRRDGPLPADRVVLIVERICTLVAGAHARGLVCGDLVLDHITVDRRGVVKLHGVAFVRPELIQCGPASDVFAIGEIAYFLITARRPTCGRLIPPVAYADISDALDDVVLRCLDRSPARRPTISALSEALRNCQS